MWDRPVVSLHGNGESVTLDNLAADWVLMQGAAGLGVSPVELSTAPLAGGGSVLQHRRFTEAEIVIPLLLGRDRFMDRFEQRRVLERLCDGLVEIRIETAEGTRSRWGWYSDGLQGDYGEGEDSIDGQKLALTFLCLDQFWKGEEHSFVYKTNAPKKPFLSVATNGRENLWDGKQLTDYTQSVWDVVDEGLEHAGEDRLAGLDLDDWQVEATEGTPFTVDMSLKFLSGDGKGRARITGVSYKDGSKISEATLMDPNRSGRFGSSFYPAPGADAVSVGLYVADSMGRDERVRVSNVVLWGPTEPPAWVEVARNICFRPQTTFSEKVAGLESETLPDDPKAGFGPTEIVKESESPTGTGYVVKAARSESAEVTGGYGIFAGTIFSEISDSSLIHSARVLVKFSFAASLKLSIGVYDADKKYLRQTTGLPKKVPPDKWTELYSSFTFTGDEKYFTLLVALSGTNLLPADGVAYIDAADAYAGERQENREWFSGDHAPDGMRSEWLGEPNNSVSVLYELQ